MHEAANNTNTWQEATRVQWIEQATCLHAGTGAHTLFRCG